MCGLYLVANTEWGNRFSNAFVQHLATPMSDHLPIILRILGLSPGMARRSKFHFKEMWVSHEECKDMNAFSWNGATFEGDILDKIKHCGSLVMFNANSKPNI